MALIRFSTLLLSLVGFISISQQALAVNLFAKAAVTYASHTSTSSGSSTVSSRTIYDLGLYYKFQGAGGWCAGGLYQNDAQGGDTSVNRTSYGVSGGWMTPRDSGPYVLGTYYISSKYGDMDEGSGYQVDLGYKFTPKSTPFAMQFSYKKYDYSKFDHSDTYIDPYFVVMVDFQ